MTTIIMVDPPNGWVYGFPRVFDFKPSCPNLSEKEYKIELKEWFMDRGYPRKDLELAMKYSRYWDQGE